MVAREVYRYTDKRGDSIIFKFDRTHTYLHILTPCKVHISDTQAAELINDPDDGPLATFHVWMHQTRSTTQWSSMLLDRVSAAERWRADKKPMAGLLLWQGEADGKRVIVRFVGYERSARGFVVEALGRIA